MSEERAAAVLRVLEADLPPSTVDIHRAVRAGRRRERTRRGLATVALAGVTGIAAVGAVTVVGGDATAPPRNDGLAAGTAVCAAAPLPALPDGRRTYPTQVSPNGRFVAGTSGDLPATPLLWTDGVLTVLPVPAGVAAQPVAVNDAGVVVGIATRDGRTLPFMIRGGVYSELALPVGTQGVANAVNARGDVVGEVTYGTHRDTTRAVVWRAPGGAPTVLTSTTRWAAAYAVGDDGTVFGSLGEGDTPYRWGPDGVGRALPGAERGRARGVAGDYVYGHAGLGDPGRVRPGGDDRTVVVDGSPPSGVAPRWVRWRLSTGAMVDVKGLEPSAVDATGAVVGLVLKAGTASVTGTPVPGVWRDGTVTELPGPDGRPTVGAVSGVSRDGTRLVGWTGGVDAPVPTVWRC